MSDNTKKLPALRPGTVVTRATLGDLPTTLPYKSGAWLGSRTYVTNKDADHAEAHTRLLKARGEQCDALNALVEKRIALGVKIADLRNILEEHQRVRDHDRWDAARKRQRERMQADYDDQLAVARNEAELARVRESAIRAQRNSEAAERVKQSEIDAWYHAAQARKNSALAEREDTAADLRRSPEQPVSESAAKQAADNQRTLDLATLDNEIDNQRQRGNEAAVLALVNLRARLSGR
jgi:hypothetical protein